MISFSKHTRKPDLRSARAWYGWQVAIALFILCTLTTASCSPAGSRSTLPIPATPMPSTTPEPSRMAASSSATPVPTQRIERTTTATPYPTPAISLSAFGVELFQIDDTGGLRQAREAGAHWVRFGAFEWDRIEPERTTPPSYRWDAVDEVSLRNAASSNLELIAVIRFAPEWAQQLPGHACGPFKNESLEALGDFLKALVARYSAAPYNVSYWELGNEPDIDPSLVPGRSIYGCWGNATDEYYGGGAYAEMLKIAYPAIKSADPTAQVLIGGLLLDCDPRDPVPCQNGSHKDIPPRFLEGILKNGGGPYFDIVSFHAYSRYIQQPGRMTNWGWPGSTTSIPEKAGFLRGVLAAYGYGDKALMNTEAALLCKEPSEDCLETQAMYVPRAYADALSAGLQGQIYFAVINDHWFNTGLVSADLAARPVYRAYAAAASFLGAATFAGSAPGYPEGVTGYAFTLGDSDQHLDLIWSADGETRTLELPPGAAAYDHAGQLVAGSGQVQVGLAPVYIQRP